MKQNRDGKKQDRKNLKQIMTFINEKTDLNWIQKKIVYIFVSLTIDSLIDTLNDELGKDWGSKVLEWKDMLEGKTPFID